MPNVRKLGLLDANNGYLRQKWGAAGLLEFEFADDTGPTTRPTTRSRRTERLPLSCELMHGSFASLPVGVTPKDLP